MGQTLSEPVVEKVCRFEQAKQTGDEKVKARCYPFGSTAGIPDGEI